MTYHQNYFKKLYADPIKRAQHLARNRSYYQQNRNQISVQKREYTARTKDARRIKEGRIERSEWLKKFSRTPAERRAIRCKKARIYEHIRRAAFKVKSEKILNPLGCTPSFFREHIQSQFKCIMCWENYAVYWEFDHIKPLSEFNVLDPEQVKILNHFSNIRPLERVENQKRRQVGK